MPSGEHVLDLLLADLWLERAVDLPVAADFVDRLPDAGGEPGHVRGPQRGCFAAGNCGRDCPSGVCHPSGIGPDRSIHASNSLAEVITVAAVNSRHERIGYSSQGEGMFERQKPDIASYSHIFANFGPGRPGGTASAYDSGTSAATPVAAGVGALLLSAVPRLSPDELKNALIESVTNVGQTIGWDRDYGHGVVNAAAAYQAVI